MRYRNEDVRIFQVFGTLTFSTRSLRFGEVKGIWNSEWGFRSYRVTFIFVGFLDYLEERQFGFIMCSRIGYRNQKPDGWFVFRAAYNPLGLISHIEVMESKVICYWVA